MRNSLSFVLPSKTAGFHTARRCFYSSASFLIPGCQAPGSIEAGNQLVFFSDPTLQPFSMEPPPLVDWEGGCFEINSKKFQAPLSPGLKNLITD
jgi:hypothetical protein